MTVAPTVRGGLQAIRQAVGQPAGRAEGRRHACRGRSDPLSVVAPTVTTMATATLPRPAAGVGGGDPAPGQLSIDDLGTPLCDVTFVVVDLETTGGSPRDCEITEIGAVKVRGGQVLGEFATLVNPRQQIPPFIAALTGITQAMVACAPPIEAVLPSFLDFCRGSVLVAHNARFDIGFLKAACTRQHLGWTNNQVLDTVGLARHVLGRDEVRNHRLATLAPYFGAGTVPNHRALEDARATVDVLHGLLERVGNVGVASWEDLATFTSRVPPARRRKRHLAEGLPHAPGVYVFVGPRDEVLYVGTSNDLRRRVRSYFTASETRARIGEMLQLATAVTPIMTTSKAVLEGVSFFPGGAKTDSLVITRGFMNFVPTTHVLEPVVFEEEKSEFRLY